MTTPFTATYSPDDNKLRLYASSRLEPELYQRVRSAGFIWAPKQELFVAPMWTPYREDLLIELAGEIDDEDTSLTDRAQERAERFDGYQENRAKDAEQASRHASQISERFAMGQPILVGHHSEKKARKDHEKADHAMRKAAKMWETSAYWQSRAAGALQHAKYKELPRTRARRVKKLQAEKRKVERSKKEAEMWLSLWSKEGLTHEQASAIADRCWLTLPRKEGDRPDFNGNPTASDALTNRHPSLFAPRTLEEIVAVASKGYPRSIAHQVRWIAHYTNRLAYEVAMLNEQGASDLIAPKARPKQPSMLNYRQAQFELAKRWTDGNEIIRQMDFTKAEYMAVNDGNRATRLYEGHKIRVAHIRIEGKPGYCRELVAVFLTDSKVHPKPEYQAPEPTPPSVPIPPRATTPFVLHEGIAKAQAIKEQLKQPVTFVIAQTLYSTPPDLVERMVDIADIEPGHRILEPSAGTGNILKALPCIRPEGEVVAVEQVYEAKVHLEPWADEVHIEDFLQCNGNLGTFDRVLMNPPFNKGVDIQHIKHAITFLNPGGRLVAICANGPRQQAQLKPLCESWEDLPEETFKKAGTNVRTALIVIQTGRQPS